LTYSDPLSPPSASLSPRLPGLDLLRGIAALCVLGLHLQAINVDHPKIFGKGYLAVDLFFMLSGYVMARTYEPRLARGLAPLHFLFARYRRLWPVMAIGGVIGLPKLLLDGPDFATFATAAGFNLLLLPVPREGVAFPLNIPAWSIFFELTANLLHALLLWRLGARWLMTLLAMTVALTVWLGLVYGTVDVGAHSEDYFAALPRVVLSYAIGIVLWRRWRDAPPIAVPPLLAFLAMPVLFASAWVLGVDSWWPDLGFIVIACPLLIAGALRFRSEQGWNSSATAALGALSFPLYAVHMPVLQGMRLLGFGSTGGAFAALAAGAAVAIGVEALARRRKQRRRATA
jgi:peptidoglycan/LPS O-acetylase OafA/YrhL